MDNDIRKLPEHMRDFGLHLVGKAVRDVTFLEIGAPYAHAIAVTTAAHGAEILIKARIAAEHPLLIFSRLPKPAQNSTDLLDIGGLLDDGQSLKFTELADMLWAATGYRLEDPKRFKEFGELRNAIVHFAVPDLNLAELTLRFAFQVIQPMVSKFWGETIVDYSEQYDDEMENYLKARLDDLGLPMPLPMAMPLKKKASTPKRKT